MKGAVRKRVEVIRHAANVVAATSLFDISSQGQFFNEVLMADELGKQKQKN